MNRYGSEEIARARKLHARGYGYMTVARLMIREGTRVTWQQVRDWCALKVSAAQTIH